jgi:hypothetical protein
LGGASPARNESGRRTGRPRRARISALRGIIQIRFQRASSREIETLKGPRRDGRGGALPSRF